MLIESKTASTTSLMLAWCHPFFRPLKRAHEASTSGMASRSADDSITRRGTHSSRNLRAFAGLTRSGRPLSWSHPKSMMWSAHRLAACRSDRSSASSEPRNSAASSARLSRDHGFLARRPRPAAGGSARMRDRMRACREANDSATGGLVAASVLASACSSVLRACDGSSWRKTSSGRAPPAVSIPALRRQWLSSLSTCEVTQPSRIIPSALWSTTKISACGSSPA